MGREWEAWGPERQSRPCFPSCHEASPELGEGWWAEGTRDWKCKRDQSQAQRHGYQFHGLPGQVFTGTCPRIWLASGDDESPRLYAGPTKNQGLSRRHADMLWQWGCAISIAVFWTKALGWIPGLQLAFGGLVIPDTYHDQKPERCSFGNAKDAWGWRGQWRRHHPLFSIGSSRGEDLCSQIFQKHCADSHHIEKVPVHGLFGPEQTWKETQMLSIFGPKGQWMFMI